MIGASCLRLLINLIVNSSQLSMQIFWYLFVRMMTSMNSWWWVGGTSARKKSKLPLSIISTDLRNQSNKLFNAFNGRLKSHFIPFSFTIETFHNTQLQRFVY